MFYGQRFIIITSLKLEGLSRKAHIFLKLKTLRTLEMCLHDAEKTDLSDVFVHQSCGVDSFSTFQNTPFQKRKFS